MADTPKRKRLPPVPGRAPGRPTDPSAKRLLSVRVSRAAAEAVEREMAQHGGNRSSAVNAMLLRASAASSAPVAHQ